MEEEKKKSFEKFTDSQKYETMRDQVGSDIAAKQLAEEIETQQELHGFDTVEQAIQDSIAHFSHLSPRLPLAQPGHTLKHWWNREAAENLNQEEYNSLMHPLAKLLFDDNEQLAALFDPLTYGHLGIFAVEITSCRANILTMAQSRTTFAKYFDEQMAIAIKDLDRIIQDDDALASLKAAISTVSAIFDYRVTNPNGNDLSSIFEAQSYIQKLSPNKQKQLLAEIDSLMEPLKIYKELTKRQDVDTDQITRIGI